mgnify:CR=1 FL=1
MDNGLNAIYRNMYEDINRSDFVLVGIGEEMQFDWNILSDDKRYNEIAEDKNAEAVIPYFQKYIINRYHNPEIDEAYEALKDLISDKNYFIVSTLIDDIIYSHGFDPGRIVTPCGGYRQLQCSADSTHGLMAVPEHYMDEIAGYYNMENGSIPEPLLCDECGALMMMNQIGMDNYAENGYLDRWKGYMEWLRDTVNHSICVIELGEGLRFPTVIRNPFEKIIAYNLKSRFYRVNETLFQISSTIAERSCEIRCNALDFMSDVKLSED